MSAVEFLPPQGASEEVCAWLFALSDEMVRYFPAVVVGGIRGANIYNDPIEEIISHLAIVSEAHRTKISEVSPFCRLLHVRGATNSYKLHFLFVKIKPLSLSRQFQYCAPSI